MAVTPTDDQPTAAEGLKDLTWLSEFLSVPERTIYNWRQRGQGPPAYKVGSSLRYRVSEVEAWLAGRHQDGPTAA